MSLMGNLYQRRLSASAVSVFEVSLRSPAPAVNVIAVLSSFRHSRRSNLLPCRSIPIERLVELFGDAPISVSYVLEEKGVMDRDDSTLFCRSIRMLISQAKLALLPSCTPRMSSST